MTLENIIDWAVTQAENVNLDVPRAILSTVRLSLPHNIVRLDHYDRLLDDWENDMDKVMDRIDNWAGI